MIGPPQLHEALNDQIHISAVEPDAELLALGRKLDAIIQRYEVACDLCRPLWDEHDRLRDEWFKAHRGFGHEELIAAAQKIQDEVGLTALYDAGHSEEQIIAEANPISRAIMAIPATTIAGLKVKAKLAKFEAPLMWEIDNDDADAGQFVARQFIDEVLSLS